MSETASRLLYLDAVCISFKSKMVLDKLSFSVSRGETFGFLGPSGAGKTTTIKLLTRQLVKNSGTIELFCRSIEQATNTDYERIGILSDTSHVYERMTIEENLRFYAKIRGVAPKRIPELLERVDLFKDRKIPIRKCSKGMRQRVTLLAALIHDPELLFLDEPTSGLDPVARAEVHSMLEELRAGGTTIFVTTHDMTEAERLCDRVGILDEGRLLACDTPDTLRLRFAGNRVRIHTKDGRMIETTKDGEGGAVIAKVFAEDNCLAIHSEEPNLEEVFLRLTGKEF